MTTTFDIPGNPFSEENKHEWNGKKLLVARLARHLEDPTVFFEIASADDGHIHTQMGEVFLISQCECWWPMPRPIFS